MADLRRYFEEFHDNIRLATYDENATLRDKRDMLVAELRDGLRSIAPTFKEFDQGSYAIRTGVIPKNGNYDIDVGLVFDSFSDQHPDPVTLKQAVETAIGRHNRTVRIRRPCVTVEYMRDGEVDYHVDLAVYAKRRDGAGLDLALGRTDWPAAKRKWQQNDPKGLIEAIKNRHSGDQAAQMRRIIRYLKRWRDHRFPAGKGPISVVLTIAAYHWFVPRFDTFTGTPQDAKALEYLMDAILSSFVTVGNSDGTNIPHLSVHSPVVPHENLLAGSSSDDMSRVHGRITDLRDALRSAEMEPLPEKACEVLVAQFGSEFPAPSPEETAKRVRKPYISTGQSA